LVLATKRAVGAEYGYPGYERTSQPKTQVKARTEKRPSPLAGIGISAILFLMGISYTFLQAAQAHLIWQVNQTKETNAAMQMDNEKLKLEVAKLKSLDRIEMIAVNQLQMVQNPGVEYLAFQAKPAANKGGEVPAVQTATAQVLAGNNLFETIATALAKGAQDRG